MTGRRRCPWRCGLLVAAVLLPAWAEGGNWPLQLAKLQVYPVSPPAETASRPAPAPAGEHAARRAVSGNPFHDPTNPDLRHLQRYEDAVAHLPQDGNGFPDWMRALREGRIAPRGNLRDGTDMDVLDLDIVMRNTKEMPWVKFPHRAHTLWLACSNCHPQPFEARAGAAQIGMADIFRGRYCGMCHDRVAFVTFFSCARCHSLPQTGRQ